MVLLIRHGLDMKMITARERESLLWAARGKTADESAMIMSISSRTVSNHLSSARSKLNAETTCHAVAKSIKSGLIRTSEIYLLVAVIFSGVAFDVDMNRVRSRTKLPTTRIVRSVNS